MLKKKIGFCSNGFELCLVSTMLPLNTSPICFSPGTEDSNHLAHHAGADPWHWGPGGPRLLRALRAGVPRAMGNVYLPLFLLKPRNVVHERTHTGWHIDCYYCVVPVQSVSNWFWLANPFSKVRNPRPTLPS